MVGVNNKSVDYDNIKLTHDLIKDSKPKNVVIEMCDQRYNEGLDPLIKSPNYDYAINEVYNAIKEDAKSLEYRSPFDLEDLEYLIGIDLCSYRMSSCRSVLGDRDYKITKKKLRSKIKLLDILEDNSEGVELVGRERDEEEEKNMSELKALMEETEVLKPIQKD